MTRRTVMALLKQIGLETDTNITNIRLNKYRYDYKHLCRSLGYISVYIMNRKGAPDIQNCSLPEDTIKMENTEK